MNNFKRWFLLYFATVVTMNLPVTVIAAEGSASQEEQRAAREARRSEFESLSAEEKDARRAQRHTRFESMSDEEKQSMRQRHGQRADGGAGRGRHHTGHGGQSGG